jgi:hypothetical protein
MTPLPLDSLIFPWDIPTRLELKTLYSEPFRLIPAFLQKAQKKSRAEARGSSLEGDNPDQSNSRPGVVGCGRIAHGRDVTDIIFINKLINHPIKVFQFIPGLEYF